MYFLLYFNLFHYSCSPLFKVSQCPTCRDKHTDCRSLIAEKLLSATLKDTPVNCKFRGSGCMFEELVVNLGDHESGCMFRSVREVIINKVF